MKKRKPHQTLGEKALLQKHGYTVTASTPYHWVVRRKGARFGVNVWPTARKIMKQYGDGATVYSNLLEEINKVFGSPPKEKELPPNIVALKEEQDEMREQGLEYFRKKFGLTIKVY